MVNVGNATFTPAFSIYLTQPSERYWVINQLPATRERTRSIALGQAEYEVPFNPLSSDDDVTSHMHVRRL